MYVLVLFVLCCIDMVCDVVCLFGLLYMDIVFGVGYDVCYVVCVVLIGMIFVLCVDGLSYNEVEVIMFEWVMVGVDVLLCVVL